MELDRALEHALDGDAVLFVGAGFSRGATNVRGTLLKTGEQFGKHLATLAGLPDGFPLDEAAEEFERARGKDALIAEIKGEFTVNAVADYHRDVLRVPWSRVYTTNYDNVVEYVAAASGASIQAVTLATEIRSLSKSGSICVHLNGFVERVTRDTVSSEIKLSDSSYLTASIAGSPWAVLLRQDLATASAVFFVGYSLYDLDIRRLLFEDPQLRDKTFFFLGPTPDATTALRTPRFGKAYHQGTSELAAAIEAKRTTYVPRDHTPAILHCFRRYSAKGGRSDVRDVDLIELFMYGSIREDLVRASVDNRVLYYRERQATTQLIAAVKRGARALAVHSRLGNGKSSLLESVRYRLSKEGYEVYSGTTKSDRLIPELRELLARPGKIAVIVDNYPDWLDAVEAFGMHASDRAVLVLAGRTATHDVVVDRVRELISDDVVEIAVDRLSMADLDWLRRVFEEYGFWGERAAWSRAQKGAVPEGAVSRRVPCNPPWPHGVSGYPPATPANTQSDHCSGGLP